MAAFCLMFVAATLTLAQGTRGTIRGIVTDASGNVVQGANVELIEAVRGVSLRTTQTDEEGVYQFVELEPSTYNIVITSAGFAEARLNEVRVEPNRNLQLDTALGVSGVTESVTVTAGEELLDRQSPTLGTTVTRQQVQDLPLNGRNSIDLALLQPGVAPAGAGFGAGAGIRVNGQRGVSNNITIDGGNNNEVAVGGPIANSPRPDAIQEFRLLTLNYESEFGRTTGAVINNVVRGGTNEFHGNVRIFYRPTFLSAARYFDQDQVSDPDRSGPGDKRRRFERKEVGGNIGGPIFLPRFGEGGSPFFNGRDRAFFFADYERRGQLVGASQTLTGLPSSDERSGIFTRPANNPLLDPAAGFAPFPIISTSGSTIRQQIPQSRFSPIGQFYLGFLPIPDASGQATVGADSTSNNDYFTSRVDYLVTQNQTVNFTLNFFRGIDASPFAFGGASVPGFGSFSARNQYNYVARHTYSITPTIVNSLLLNYSRNNAPGVVPSQIGTLPTDIGFATNSFVVNPSVAGAPRVTLLNRGIILGNSIQGPQTRISENFQIQDAVSYVTGDHRFKFGFDGTKYRQDQEFLFVNQGIFTFAGTFGGNTTGDDLADLLIGNTPIAQQFGSGGLRDYRQTFFAFFGQDTWRVTPEFTLSLGLRYEYYSPITDLFDRVAYYREGATSQLLASGQFTDERGTPITIPAGRRAPVGLVFVGDPDPVLGGTVPRGGIARDVNNFAPRFGFAYSPRSESGFRRTLLGDNQTVIRGGFGVYYDAIIGDTALQQLTATGFGGTNAFFFPGGGTLADPFAPDPFGRQTQITNPFTSQGSIPVSAPLSQFAQPIDPLIRTPYTYQYNFTVERAFLSDFVAQFSYVGTRSKKQYAQEQINPSLGTFFAANRPLPVATATNSNSRRLNDDIRLGLSRLVSAGRGYYDAFQTQLTKRLSDDGLSLQVSYTFSKSITDADTQRGGLDILDRNFGRSLSSQDVPHRFVVNGLYELPFTRNVENGFLRVLFGGVTVGGIYTYQSGTPFSVGNPFDTTGAGGGVFSFADRGSEAFTEVSDPQSNNNLAFNPGAFSVFGNPAQGFVLARDFRRGTSGANQFRVGNGFNNFDLVFIKRTRFTESVNLELRLDAFNAFNHTQFSDIDLNLFFGGRANPNFGRFIDTREARVLQLAARFSF